MSRLNRLITEGEGGRERKGNEEGKGKGREGSVREVIYIG